MKKLSIWIVCAFLLFTGVSFANEPSQGNEVISKESSNQPVQSGFSFLGGLLILASIGAGYSVKRFYIIRVESESDK